MDTVAQAVVNTLPLFDPTPSAIKIGPPVSLQYPSNFWSRANSRAPRAMWMRGLTASRGTSAIPRDVMNVIDKSFQFREFSAVADE